MTVELDVADVAASLVGRHTHVLAVVRLVADLTHTHTHTRPISHEITHSTLSSGGGIFAVRIISKSLVISDGPRLYIFSYKIQLANCIRSHGK